MWSLLEVIEYNIPPGRWPKYKPAGELSGFFSRAAFDGNEGEGHLILTTPPYERQTLPCLIAQSGQAREIK